MGTDVAHKSRVTKVTMSLGPKAYSFLTRDKGGEIWMWSYESEVLLSPTVATPVAGAVQGAVPLWSGFHFSHFMT